MSNIFLTEISAATAWPGRWLPLLMLAACFIKYVTGGVFITYIQKEINIEEQLTLNDRLPGQALTKWACMHCAVALGMR
jgi:hypothetical protein